MENMVIVFLMVIGSIVAGPFLSAAESTPVAKKVTKVAIAQNDDDDEGEDPSDDEPAEEDDEEDDNG